jgi:hypothetical protein
VGELSICAGWKTGTVDEAPRSAAAPETPGRRWSVGRSRGQRCASWFKLPRFHSTSPAILSLGRRLARCRTVPAAARQEQEGDSSTQPTSGTSIISAKPGHCRVGDFIAPAMVTSSSRASEGTTWGARRGQVVGGRGSHACRHRGTAEGLTRSARTSSTRLRSKGRTRSSASVPGMAFGPLANHQGPSNLSLPDAPSSWRAQPSVHVSGPSCRRTTRGPRPWMPRPIALTRISS